MKLFRTSNIHVVSDCQEQFNFVLPSVQLARRLFFVCVFCVLPVFGE